MTKLKFELKFAQSTTLESEVQGLGEISSSELLPGSDCCILSTGKGG